MGEHCECEYHYEAEPQCALTLLQAEHAALREQLATTHGQVAEVARMLDPEVMPDAWGLRNAAAKVLRERDEAQSRLAEAHAALLSQSENLARYEEHIEKLRRERDEARAEVGRLKHLLTVSGNDHRRADENRAREHDAHDEETAKLRADLADMTCLRSFEFDLRKAAESRATGAEGLARDLAEAREALRGFVDMPMLGDAGYCDVCERHAPKNDHGLTGPVEHELGCPVGHARAVLAKGGG